MIFDERIEEILRYAVGKSMFAQNEYVTPEHILYAMMAMREGSPSFWKRALIARAIVIMAVVLPDPRKPLTMRYFVFIRILSVARAASPSLLLCYKHSPDI